MATFFSQEDFMLRHGNRFMWLIFLPQDFEDFEWNMDVITVHKVSMPSERAVF